MVSVRLRSRRALRSQPLKPARLYWRSSRMNWRSWARSGLASRREMAPLWTPASNRACSWPVFDLSPFQDCAATGAATARAETAAKVM